MSLQYAVVDIETTGNNIDNDEIIQIGIVIIRDGKIIKTYDSFIYSNIEIPPFIQSLTGITNDMVKNAPKFSDIAHDILKLLENAVFVAHNVDFDLKFLKRYFDQYYNAYHPKYIIDTVDVFKMLYPKEERYQLSALAESFGYNLQNAHRAIDDAYVTAQLLIRSLEKLESLPLLTLKKIYGFVKNMRYHFDEVIFQTILSHHESPHHYQIKNGLYYHNLEHITFEDIHFDMELNELYEFLTDHLNFQYREEQLKLIDSILDNMLRNDTVYIEAELGSGKTFCYLVAALYYMSMKKKNVLISTSTIALQNQLIENDLKALEQVLSVKIPYKIFKSRKHFISVDFVDFILNDGKENHDILLLKIQLIIFLLESKDGDIETLNLNGGRKIYFNLMQSLYKVKRGDTYLYDSEQDGNVIGVTNHAHLLADRSRDMFSRFETVIIDEAHQLDQYALYNTTTVYEYSEMKYMLSQLTKSFKPVDLHHKKPSVYEIKYERDSTLLIEQVHAVYEQFYDYLLSIMPYQKILKIDKNTHSEFGIYIGQVISSLSALNKAEAQSAEFKSIYKKLRHIFETLKSAFQHECYLLIEYKNQSKSGMKIYLKNYTVSEIIKQAVNEMFPSIIYLSGTMRHTIDDNEKNEVIIYDKIYEKYKATMFIPDDIDLFDYKQLDTYLNSCLNYILYYLSQSDGKTLILVNSYQQIDYLRSMLNETVDDLVILTQNNDTSTAKLNQQFNALSEGVLIATQTFYEGIDFKSDKMKSVMIITLPFMHPNDLAVQLMESETDHVFMNYQLPQAVNKLHQATGRLIRNETDKGFMVCFDRRIIEGKYRKYFENVLSHYHIVTGDIHQFEHFIKKVSEQVNIKK